MPSRFLGIFAKRRIELIFARLIHLGFMFVQKGVLDL